MISSIRQGYQFSLFSTISFMPKECLAIVFAQKSPNECLIPFPRWRNTSSGMQVPQVTELVNFSAVNWMLFYLTPHLLLLIDITWCLFLEEFYMITLILQLSFCEMLCLGGTAQNPPQKGLHSLPRHKHSWMIRKCQDDILPEASCSQWSCFRELDSEQKGKRVMFLLPPFLSPPPSSASTNSSRVFFPQNKHRKWRLVTFHDSPKNKVWFRKSGHTHATFLWLDS